MLVAALIDAVNSTRYTVVKAAGGKGVQPPEPVPRPGTVKREAPRMSRADRAAIETRQRPR